MANAKTKEGLLISSCQQETAFQIPLFIIRIADWGYKKEKLLSLVNWEEPEGTKDFGESTHAFSDYYIHLRTGCPYKEQFHKHLLEEFHIFSERINTGFELRDLWAQRYYNTDGMEPHTHGTSSFSGVLYAEFDTKEHEATTFMAPFNNFITDRNLYCTPKITEGSIVIFPSMLTHFAAANRSSKPRTIFSFNLLCNPSVKR